MIPACAIEDHGRTVRIHERVEQNDQKRQLVLCSISGLVRKNAFRFGSLNAS